jgi:arylsulfatase A-like enzyme
MPMTILACDLGAADAGAYGATGVRTPHLDRLAREGMRFTQAFNPCSSCSPNRASITNCETGSSSGARIPWTSLVRRDRATPSTALPASESGYSLTPIRRLKLSGCFSE